MKIDLDITYDDLSDSCKEKIKKLQRLVGKDSITINYPEINKFIRPGDYDWEKQTTFPSWPVVGAPHITCKTTSNDDTNTSGLIHSEKKIDRVNDTVIVGYGS